jgi:hypothetical protein
MLAAESTGRLHGTSDQLRPWHPQAGDPVAWSEAAMEKFVHRQNIERYRKLLRETEDPEKRQQIAKLLAEEPIAKLPSDS